MSPRLERFVIMTVPRTGSNMLCTMLNSHPEILCHHEIFNPAGVFYALDLRDGSFTLGSCAERRADPLEFYRRIWRRPLGRPRVGFKFCLSQEPEIYELLAGGEPTLKRILIRRRNRIKPFVSYKIAELLDQWEVYDPGELIAERPQVEVDLGELRANIVSTEEYYERLSNRWRNLGREQLTVWYEELLEPAGLSEVLTFLGVRGDPAEKLAIGSVKQNPTDLRQLISNYDQLSRSLAGTDLASDLAATGF